VIEEKFSVFRVPFSGFEVQEIYEGSEGGGKNSVGPSNQNHDKQKFD